MDYLTIDKEYSDELSIKKSKFIAFIFHCKDEEEFQNRYKSIKKQYFDATHVIPVYRIIKGENIIKEHFSDDREPAKTAGWPILYILQQKALVQIGVIVVRYFGGIKLGTSGLQKAYSEVVLNSIRNANIIPYIKLKEIKIRLPIDLEYHLHEILRNKFESFNIKIQNISYIEEKNLNYALITLSIDESKIKEFKFLLKEKISDLEIIL